MIDNFNWPVQRQDIKRFADDITNKTILFIKKNKQLHNEIDFISINYRFIINDIINIYVAKKFLSYKQEANYFFDNKLIDEIRLNKQISLSHTICRVLKGLKKKNHIFFFLSRLKKFLFDKIKYIKKENIDSNYHIITFSNNELIKTKANFLKRNKVKLSYFQDWFPSGELKLQDIKVNKGKCFTDFHNLIIKFFLNYDLELSKNEVNYFLRLLETWYKITYFFENKLTKNKENLPKELWIGTSGIFYNRIFAKAVRGNGGKVYGFAHSSADIVKSIDQMITEYNHVDSFYTYNKNAKEIALESFNKKFIFNNFNKENILYVNEEKK